MKARFPSSLVVVFCATVAQGVPWVAAAQGPTRDPGEWEVPRTPDGHPDLQGNWSNATLTPFEREEGREPLFTRAEVEELEQWIDGCPPNPGSVDCGRLDNRADESLSDEARLSGAAYNEVYFDGGTRVAVVNGEPRTSLLTRPPNGRRPPLTPEGERRVAEFQALREQFGQYDHPELLPLNVRCVVWSGGPPIVPNRAYNNNYTIIQTADHVVIMTEMIHDARIIRLGEPEALPDDVRPWFGDSRGRWEGDVLVVETTNVHPDQISRGVPPSEDLRVIERFSRVDEETLLYEFTIDDPDTYTSVWGGEIPFKRLHAQVYEYACHEGNYSFSNILSGARYEERVGAEIQGR